MYLGERVMSDYWSANPPTDVIITTYDLLENRPRLIKSWKSEYEDWPAVKALLASRSAPTYFPVVDGQFVDGGLGTFRNPCYLAAYEIAYVLNWEPEETTLISLGTGRYSHAIEPRQPEDYYSWQWIEPLFDAFLSSASDQQVHLVDTMFTALDFRRFQVDLKESIPMDDAGAIPELIPYGEEMGQIDLKRPIRLGPVDRTPGNALETIEKQSKRSQAMINCLCTRVHNWVKQGNFV